MIKGSAPRSAAVLAILFAFALPRTATAQAQAGESPSGGPAPLTLAGAGRDFLRDAGRIWSSPARLKTRDIVPLLAIAATAAFLVSADERTRDAVQGYADLRPWVGDAGSVITLMGNEGAWGTAGAFFGLGLLLKDERAKETGYLAVSALAQSLLVDTVMKGVFGRQRPDYGGGVDRWSGPAGFFERFETGMSGKFDSFPSGHTTKAFALAAVVAHQYRHAGWVPVLSYAVAAGVGLSRMALDRHWSSDVFCGAILGYAVARLVIRNHDRPHRLVPTLACSKRGVALGLVYDLGPSGS